MATHSEVTGSCFILNPRFPSADSEMFGIDCGLFQERDYQELNSSFPFNPENMKFFLVTHNHVDHVGRLPLLVKQGFSKPIYVTAPTAKLLPYALMDSEKVLKDTAKRVNQKPLYTEADVDKTLKLVVPCEYDEPIQVADNIRVTFLKNGHLIGASMIYVQISYEGFDDINLLFTGDWHYKNLFFDVNPIPIEILTKPLTIIQESTYGTMESCEIVERFEQNVLNALEENKSVIVPVFSLGRSQEILYKLMILQEKGKLSLDVPIYLDGKLAIRYTNLYLKEILGIKPDMMDFLPKNLTFVDKTIRPQVIYDYNKKIVLTTSGMGSYGPAQVYLPEYVARKDALIHFTGYVAEGTLGRKLKDTPNGETVEIGGLVVRKKADVEYTTEYSAHAKADDMIRFLQQFKNLKLVLLNHGETETKQRFAKRILDEVDTKQLGILNREYLFRVNPYGFQKSLSTKFK